jgi:hypothetical protein
MINLMNVKCLKLRSNSGRKLLDNQLQYIANQHSIPMSFLSDMRAKNYSKIFFEMSSTKIELIGYTFNDRLQLLEKYRKVPDIIKAQISILETIPIPKETVNQNNVNKSSSKKDNAPVSKNKKQADSSKENTNNSQYRRSGSPSHTDKRKDNAELDFDFILKINLKQSDEELQKLCEKTTLNIDFLKENSEHFSVLYYLQVKKNSFVLFAYSRKNSSKIEFMKDFCEDLFQMKFTTFPSNQKSDSSKHKPEIKNQDGTFSPFGWKTYFWTATGDEKDTYGAWSFGFDGLKIPGSDSHRIVEKSWLPKEWGLSVRLIKM